MDIKKSFRSLSIAILIGFGLLTLFYLKLSYFGGYYKAMREQFVFLKGNEQIKFWVEILLKIYKTTPNIAPEKTKP